MIKKTSVIVIFGFGLTLVLTLFYMLYRKGYNHYFSFEQDRIREIVTGKTQHDILFIGSSRTFYHVNPRVIDSVTGYKSYNAGMDGANLLEMNLLLKCYLQSHKVPQLIVVDISTPAFDIEFKPVFNPTIYYQFLNHDTIYKALAPYQRVSLLKHLPFTRLTEITDFEREGALLGLANKQKVPPEDHNNGYLSSGHDTIKLPFRKKYLQTHFEIGSQGVQLLDELISAANQARVPIIFTYAPVYKQNEEKVNEAFFPYLRTVSEKYKIPFYNYRNIYLSDNHLLFRDETHLNESGANLYSATLAKDIQDLITKTP